eukprot:XP_020404686.1 basic proline-rich protein-like [Zea mays]
MTAASAGHTSTHPTARVFIPRASLAPREIPPARRDARASHPAHHPRRGEHLARVARAKHPARASPPLARHPGEDNIPHTSPAPGTPTPTPPAIPGEDSIPRASPAPGTPPPTPPPPARRDDRRGVSRPRNPRAPARRVSRPQQTVHLRAPSMAPSCKARFAD